MISISVLELALGFGSKIRILRFFTRHPEVELTKREIARMVGISHNAANIAMRDLSNTNLFMLKRAGPSHLYSLNKGSALLPVLTHLFEGEAGLREDLIARVKGGLTGKGTAIIFGSYARGEETMDSDLDILVITDDKREAKKACDGMLLPIRERFDVHLSPIIMTKHEFETKKKKPVYKNALSEGILLTGERPEV